MAEMLDYYVEQGAGIDLIVAPLHRIPPRSVRRCLEIGGAFGFALDFGRHVFGWEVLEVDPSPLAAAGAEALGLPVRRCYFDADLDLGPEPFDLAILSEVLEHVAEPHGLLAAIRDRLTPEGILVLSTPNLAVVRPETEEGALGRALSPGLHLVLYDRRSLVRVLEQAGFAAVHVEESPETLRAFAARSPEALARLRPADPATERALLRGYLADRAASAPPGSALACGFAYRLFKEQVNAGLYEEAVASRDRLARVYRERFRFDLEKPDLDKPVVEADRKIPFNLTGALFFSGILELNQPRPTGQGRRGLRGGDRGRHLPAGEPEPVRAPRRRDRGSPHAEPQAPADGARGHRSGPGGARDRGPGKGGAREGAVSRRCSAKPARRPSSGWSTPAPTRPPDAWRLASLGGPRSAGRRTPRRSTACTASASWRSTRSAPRRPPGISSGSASSPGRGRLPGRRAFARGSAWRGPFSSRGKLTRCLFRRRSPSPPDRRAFRLPRGPALRGDPAAGRDRAPAPGAAAPRAPRGGSSRSPRPDAVRLGSLSGGCAAPGIRAVRRSGGRLVPARRPRSLRQRPRRRSPPISGRSAICSAIEPADGHPSPSNVREGRRGRRRRR